MFKEPYYKVACHTDYVTPGTTFVAIKGMESNGIDFISNAIAKGATTIVLEQGINLNLELQKLINQYKVSLNYVQNTRAALSSLSAKAYEYPANSLKIIGVTGTKGKTTTCYLIEHILKSAGKKTALLTSVKNKIINYEDKSTLTTPQPDYLHKIFYECKLNNVEYVIMEVAAQALNLHRIDDINFDEIVFTNFSHEHSEFYPSLTEYFEAKCKIFDKLKPNGSIIFNQDDHKINMRLSQYNFKKLTFGLTNNSDFYGKVNTINLDKSQFDIIINNTIYNIKTSLIGSYNLYNILGAIAATLNQHIPLEIVLNSIENFNSVPGRMQKYFLSNGSIGIIDLANGPAAFENVLSTLRKFTNNLIVVFGAGGDRDQNKRPIMGQIASEYADIIILTTDNPRSESVINIINDINKGIKNKNKIIELDRKNAILQAFKLSTNGSIIALLGKGIEEYQIINNVKIPFNESSILATL